MERLSTLALFSVPLLLMGGFYTLGFLNALGTVLQSTWNDGQIYSRQDHEAPAVVSTQQ